MASFNMRQLEDRARDVDPDLRYMALEDFQKRLNNPQAQPLRNVAFFVPILFSLLGDSATEVQNQAVKSFAPLVRHSTDKETTQIVSNLYSEVEKTSNDSKFSTSVPTLALRSILSESHALFNPKLSRDLFEMLLPRIFAPDSVMTIDKIEILIDMIKALGSALRLAELLSIISSLISGAFVEKGIIGKRSIIAVDACLCYVKSASLNQAQQTQFYDKVVLDVVAESARHVISLHSTDVFYTLFQVILAQASNCRAVSDSSIQVIFHEVLQGLRLDQVGETVDAEDLDIDELIQINLLRENALITLAGLVPCFSIDTFTHTYASQVFEILDRFMVYDPLLYEDSDEEAFSGEDSELDFSDDEDIEQFENTGENDALAAKLRLLALVVLKKLLQHNPEIASMFLAGPLTEKLIANLADRSEIVSSEAIVALVVLIRLSVDTKRTVRSRSNSDTSMATESADHIPFSVLAREYIEPIEQKIFASLLTAKNILRFSNSKILIESLILGFSHELSEDFLIKLADSLLTFKLSLKTFPEVVKTYKALFSVYDFEDLPEKMVDYISEDLGEALLAPSNYHSVILDVLVVCEALYKKVAHIPKYNVLMNTKFFPAIADNLTNKEYSSDIRQYLLDTFSELIIHVNLSPENQKQSNIIFQQSLDYEVTVNFTIETMVKVCEQKPEIFSYSELCLASLEKLTAYLGSSNASLYISALTLLNAIFENTSFVAPADDISALKDVLFVLMNSSVDLNLIGKSFMLLGHILTRTPADGNFLLLLFTLVINTKFVDVEDANMKPLEFLITQISKHNFVGSEKLYDFGMNLLCLKNFISAKVMALICTNCRLSEKVYEIEKELTSYIHNFELQVDASRIVFDIQFLGYISTVESLKKFTFQEFLEIPKRDTKDHICLAAARAMGLSIVRNLNTHLPILLSCYQKASSEDDPNRSLYLVALKQLLKEGSWVDGVDALRNIWDSLIKVIVSKRGELSHKEVLELKLAGDVLSSITELDRDGNYQHKILTIVESLDSSAREEHIIYTVVVIMKRLVGKSTDDFEVHIIEKTMEYLAISNLELKLAIVSTLLTGIYNKSLSFSSILNSVILPAIYEELTAKVEFRKTIPMGPYKYVVDEGLEVRKLSYELISAIINLNSSKAQKVPFMVDEVKVFEVLLDKGLKDQENEIINLTVYNLMQLIQMNESVLSKISNQQELIFSFERC
ncbi:hypothetical protein METBIDRAFT_79109 [Metschnikowia bicuspidata var. bicuspidata NRRL YB-4993]|uniref:TATA-binding protein interacting (TIP20) domain-containing protein n=1 Tax=Metschnikowia bicuspidata var. bicuspidata NRRL YB-4993 TaxID=869754 RepID=A0A1A0H6T1_9ASCO|nr:hypothetical protein METBIDRAFT_79109 [Metschnikowia bicuspidata var. bicuspidata NRRL YB-4993]OBA19736.1 hypothetical protein METBIDRAFT_79109 [Metschnikowia bicuspidata var. bicuspidata NRRL YB-4993]